MATTPALAAIAALLLLGPAAAQNTFSGQFLLTDSSGGTPAELVAVVYDMFPPSPHDDIPAPRYDVGGTLELKGFDVLPSPQTAVPLFRASGTEAVFVASGKGGKPGFRAVTAQFYEFDQPNVTAEVALDPTVATGSYDSTWAATLQLDTKANKLWAVRSSDAKGNEFGSFDMASGKWTPEFALDGSNAEDWLVSAWAQKAQVFTVLSISGTNSSDVHSYVIHVDELSNVTGRVQKYTVADPQYFDLKQDSFRQLSFDPLTGIAWFVRPSGGMEGPVVDLYGLNIFDTQGDSMLLTGPVEGGGEGVSVCSKQSSDSCFRVDGAGSSMWYGLLDSNTETDGVVFTVGKYSDGTSTNATQRCMVFDQISDGQGWQVGMDGCFLPTAKPFVAVAAAAN